MTVREMTDAIRLGGSGGGSAPVLETLTATANGTYTPDVGVDGFDEVDVQVAPPDPEWRSFTVTGTLDAPFSWNDLMRATDMRDKVLAEMVVNSTVIGAGSAVLKYAGLNNGVTYWSACEIPDTTVSNAMAAVATYTIDNVNRAITLNTAYMMQQGAIVDVSQYASLMPTTTTFVYHHIPSSND